MADRLALFSKFLTLATVLATLVGGAASAGERVVIADGVATEIAYALGVEDRVVGVDTTSTYPVEAKEKPQLGYFRRLSAEGILALTPDLVIASPNAGPAVVLEQVSKAGTRVVRTPLVASLEDIPAKIIAVGDFLGAVDRAKILATEITTKIQKIKEERPNWENPPRTLFVMTIRGGTPLVAGRDTGPDEVIKAAGGMNVADFEGYKPMSREALVSAAPTLIVVTAEHARTLGGPDEIMIDPIIQLTPAGQNGRGIALPALAVLGLGPRTPDAVIMLREEMRKNRSESGSN